MHPALRFQRSMLSQQGGQRQLPYQQGLVGGCNSEVLYAPTDFTSVER